MARIPYNGLSTSVLDVIYVYFTYIFMFTDFYLCVLFLYMFSFYSLIFSHMAVLHRTGGLFKKCLGFLPHFTFIE